MKKVGTALKRFWGDENGLETVEYAVIAGLLVLAVIGAIFGVSVALDQKFQDLEDAIANPPGG